MAPRSSGPPSDGKGDSGHPPGPSGDPTLPLAGDEQPTRPLEPRQAAWVEQDDLVGKTISQYEITERLGEGGMGVVYKAHDTRLDRTVALKFLSTRFLSNKELTRRFLHEAQAAAGLDDPHICTVHEIHEADGYTFIVMAYVEGQSLQAKLAPGPLEMREALDIARQIGRGLSRAHRQGIVHRDIKPGNVLLTPEGQVKIVDFGLAKLAARTQLTRTGVSMGTVSYMSPEQARGGEVDHRTDIWALGVVLYEMLTGTLPFRGENEQAVIHSILQSRPHAVSDTRKDVSIGVERVVERALARNPAKRYQEIDDLLADLDPQITAVQLGQGPGRFAGLRRVARKRSVRYAALVTVVVAALVSGSVMYQARTSVVDSVAVLPFANLSGDREQEYFSDGMTEALINELGQIGAIKVISRTSVMQYKDTKKTLPEIAKELAVDAVVEASVLRNGDNVQIRAALIRANPERQLWADSYTREAKDVLSVHEDVARSIADRIKTALTPGERTRLSRSRTIDPDAFDAYLKGQYSYNRETADGFQQALAHFQKAVSLDPAYAAPYAGMADCYTWLCFWGVIPSQEAFPKAKAAATKAIELDPEQGHALATRGATKFLYDWDWDAAEADFKKALELSPNDVDAHGLYSFYLVFRRRFDQAVDHSKRVVELDPLTPTRLNELAWTYYYAGRYDESITASRKALELEPMQANFQIWQAYALEKKGMRAEALAACDSAYQAGFDNVDLLFQLGHLYGLLGETDKARTILDHLLELSKQSYMDPFNIAMVYAGLGDAEKTFDYLDLAYEDHSPNMIALDGDFSAFRENPRFQALHRKVGLPDI